MVVIIDYKMGNIRSVFKAFEVIGAKVCISDQPNIISQADQIVLPGVGAFAEGINNLKKLHLVDLLTEQVKIKQKPFLGICLGMQLLASEGYEDGFYHGLDWLPSKVVQLDTLNGTLKLPHIGWNEVSPQPENLLFKEMGAKPIFYFVHSYHIVCESKWVNATCNYGQEFTASIQCANIFGTQFHPEKSQKNGLQLLKNFLAI